MKLAKRMNRLGTETAFEVLAKAKILEAEGVDVIHLEIGEPDFDTPENIINAGSSALSSGYTHYGPSPGLPELREKIAEEISSTRKIPISSENVVVTPGGKPIMFFCILALIEQGDEVLYPNPGFPTKFPGLQERTIILDGFSKTYAMTGWRIGHGIMPIPLVEPISRLMTNSVSCTASFTQIAAKEALTGSQDEANKIVSEFKKRRDIIVNGLNNINGISCKTPKGAFYVFPNIKETGISSKKFADDLLQNAGVASLNGESFGKFGKDYVRFSFANSTENILEALNRIESFVQKI